MRVARIARHIVERLTRRWVFRRRLPKAFGGASLYVSPSAGLKFLFKPMATADPALLRAAMLVRSGDVVWDVGANIGLFSVAAAVRAGDAGKVIAFEPDIWLVGLLRRTARIRQPQLAPLTVVPCAVAKDVGVRPFQIATRSRASNALAGYGSSQMGGVTEEQIVPTFNLDWLLDHFPAPQVVKIDVEGAELEVLAGQLRMLRDVRPRIICEVSSSSAVEVTAAFTRAGYILYDGDQPLEDALPIGQASWCTIALPSEQEGKPGGRAITAQRARQGLPAG